MSVYAYDTVLDTKNNKNYFAINDNESATSTSVNIKIKDTFKIQFRTCYTEHTEYVPNQSKFKNARFK